MSDTSGAKPLARGPHAIKIDGSGGVKGPLKLSISLLSIPNAEFDDMAREPIIAALESESPKEMTIQDLMPNESQRHSILHQSMIIAVKALLNHEPAFRRYQNEPLFQFEKKRPLPKSYHTKCYDSVHTVVGESSMKTYESAVNGVYLEKLNLDGKEFADRAIPSINTAAVNAAIRKTQAAVLQRRDKGINVDDSEPLLSLELGPGLLDVLKKLVKAVLKTHLRAPNTPGSLSQTFTLLNKTHLAQGKAQDFPQLLETIDTIVLASFMDQWRINCGYASLSAYATTHPSPEAILALAKKIVLKHVERVVPKDPTNPNDADFDFDDPEYPVGEDQVWDYNRLKLRDLLYVVLLKRAIGDGDFGRVEDFLGVICIFLMGADMEQTAKEIGVFVHRLKYVWPEPFADIMRDSMILNLFQNGANNMPADVTTEYLSTYSKFYFTANDLEDRWHKPTSLADGVALIDEFDRQMSMKDGECVVM